MESRYILNIAKDGSHYFEIVKSDTIYALDELREIASELREIYPYLDGYDISVTYYECIGTECKL